MVVAETKQTGRLYVVATPIGNLEDITLRALRVLGEVGVIAAEDTRAAQHLLAHHRVRAGRPAVKLLSFFAGNEAARTAELCSLLLSGEDVAVISEAGLPGISDPGQRLVAAAVAAGIPVEVVPGACAALTALVASGLGTGRFLFVGFPPRAEGERQALFGALRRETATLIFYESPERLSRTLADLALALGAERPACVSRELTKLYEEHRRGPLSELSRHYDGQPPRGEITLVVGGSSDEAAVGESTIESLEAEVRARLLRGQSAREIAAALSLQSGKSRRQLYQLAISLRPESSDASQAE